MDEGIKILKSQAWKMGGKTGLALDYAKFKVTVK